MGNTMTGYEEEEKNTEVGGTTGEDLYAVYEDAYNALKNRGSFEYSAANDPIYQQYKSAAEKSGRLAMKDTVGQISALNGGYANSYAQTAGQQMYQSALDNVDNMIPELYDVARQRYDNETAALQNRFDTASDTYIKYENELTEREKNKLSELPYDDYTSLYEEIKMQAGAAGADYAGLAKYIAGIRMSDEQRAAIEGLLPEQYRTGGVSTTPYVYKPGAIDPDVYGPVWDPIDRFTKSLLPSDSHDQIQRNIYGSYGSYVAAMLNKADYLSEDEKAYYINLYGITESDIDELYERASVMLAQASDDEKADILNLYGITESELDDFKNERR